MIVDFNFYSYKEFNNNNREDALKEITYFISWWYWKIDNNDKHIGADIEVSISYKVDPESILEYNNILEIGVSCMGHKDFLEQGLHNFVNKCDEKNIPLQNIKIIYLYVKGLTTY